MGEHSLEAAEAEAFRRHGVTAKARFVDVPCIGGRARVFEVGEGPPLVAMPGLIDPAALLAPLLGELDGHKVYVVERPGAGRTDFARPRPSTFRSLSVRFTLEVMDALGLERVGFFGNSMGSLTVLWFALDRPSRVKFMVHAGCPAFILGTGAPRPLRAIAAPGLGRMILRLSPASPHAVERFARMVGEDLGRLPEVRDALVESARQPHAADALHYTVRAGLTPRGPRPEVVLDEAALAEVTQPALFLWGERDPFGSPRVGERVVAAMPDAELAVLPAGHLPWLSAAPEVAGAIRAFAARRG